MSIEQFVRTCFSGISTDKEVAEVCQVAHYILELSKTTRTGPPNIKNIQSVGKVEY